VIVGSVELSRFNLFSSRWMIVCAGAAQDTCEKKMHILDQYNINLFLSFLLSYLTVTTSPKLSFFFFTADSRNRPVSFQKMDRPPKDLGNIDAVESPFHSTCSTTSSNTAVSRVVSSPQWWGF
jgi:hypothetical protein